jgi:ParB-like chromosome segregation protein Spo0J
MASLKEHAGALLKDVEAAEAHRVSERLTATDRALILRLAAKGNLSQEGIAKAVGCSQPTVSRVLALMDTRKEARTILESGAVTLAQTVVDTNDAGIALKALGKLDVVREDRGDQTNIAILMGTPEHPSEPPIITIPSEISRT